MPELTWNDLKNSGMTWADIGKLPNWGYLLKDTSDILLDISQKKIDLPPPFIKMILDIWAPYVKAYENSSSTLDSFDKTADDFLNDSEKTINIILNNCDVSFATSHADIQKVFNYQRKNLKTGGKLTKADLWPILQIVTAFIAPPIVSFVMSYSGSSDFGADIQTPLDGGSTQEIQKLHSECTTFLEQLDNLNVRIDHDSEPFLDETDYEDCTDQEP